MAIRVPRCPHCPHSRVSTSRLRWYEWPLLVLLRLPFRCLCCGLRFIGRYRLADIPELIERNA